MQTDNSTAYYFGLVTCWVRSKKLKRWSYFGLKLITVRSRLSSRCDDEWRGGEVLLPPASFEFPMRVFRDRLNLAISSPNTSPVRRAEIKSSNSPLLSVVAFESPFLNPKFLATELSRPSLFLRSMVRFLSWNLRFQWEFR